MGLDNSDKLEAVYQYIWKHTLCGRHLKTVDGEDVTILSPGQLNEDAGPDFFNARIERGGTEWCGNIEIHVKASDWYRHGHQSDPAYDNIILHVVAINDARIERQNKSLIPQTCIAASKEFFELYAGLTEGMNRPGCLPYLWQIDVLKRTDWVETLGIERLQEKSQRLKELLESQNGDWYQALFILLARGLGFGLNSVPFELTAKSIALNYLMRHRDNLFQLEALLFGQAGMLGGIGREGDEYYGKLCREYAFLSQKYSLTPVGPGIWKYSRTRPQNFPHRRIALLAASLSSGLKLQESLLEAAGDSDRLREIFDFEMSEYWGNHSDFGREGEAQRHLSRGSINLLLINVAAPFYYTYGALTGNYDLSEKGIDLLNELNPERNCIIQMWAGAGLKAESAFQSQALLHLRKEYCDKSRCLECRFGHTLLRKNIL